MAFVPFQTPQAPSLDHSCDITSIRASCRFKVSWCEGGGDLFGGSGVSDLSLCCLRDREGEYECAEGAEDVKYACSSWSESSEWYFIES